MKVELPETIALSGEEKKPEKERREPIKLGFTGYVVIQDTWTGGDFEDFHKVPESDSKKKTADEITTWERIWPWAKARIVEWAIEGLPTNPNQINDDEDLTWALESFLASSVIAGMNDYMKEGIEKIKELIDFPIPDDLRPGEFLAWHKAMREAEKEENRTNVLRGWMAGKVLVREWPKGMKPKDDRSADLRLMVAVDELLSETILPSLNLGNWSAPLGVD
jgi:hypothetical protein